MLRLAAGVLLATRAAVPLDDCNCSTEFDWSTFAVAVLPLPCAFQVSASPNSAIAGEMLTLPFPCH